MNTLSPSYSGDAQERWVLFAEWRLPMPDHNAGSLRLFFILKATLDAGFKVHWHSEYELDNYLKFFIKDSKELDKYKDLLKELGVTFTFGRKALQEHLRDYGMRYSHFYFIYPEVAYLYIPYVRAYSPYAKVIFDVLDLHCVRKIREHELTGENHHKVEAEHYKQMESILCRAADKVVAVSQHEMDFIKSELGSSRQVEILPTIHECVKSPVSFGKRSGLFFIGTFLHSPNLDAVLYFLNEIFPILRINNPEMQIDIVGSNCPQSIKNLNGNGVNVIGYVEDLTPLYDKYKLMVAPLRFGAGVKGKIADSLGHGLPVVTTPIGAEGMGLDHGKNIMVGDTPEEFAKAVQKIYYDENLWQSLSDSGYDLIKKSCSYEAIIPTVERVFDVE